MFPINTILARIINDYHEQGSIIITTLLLPLGHISNNTPIFLQANEHLVELKEPFPNKKIDDILQKIPTDKAPGPDRFNGSYQSMLSHHCKNISMSSLMISTME